MILEGSHGWSDFAEGHLLLFCNEPVPDIRMARQL